MEWVKLLATPPYYLDGALLRAGEAAEVLFLRALAYTGNGDTRGLVDKTVLPLICPNRPQPRADALVREGLWVDEGMSYRIRSWDRIQDAHDAAAEKQRKDRDRQREYRRRKAAGDVAVPVTSHVTSADAPRDVTPCHNVDREGDREGDREKDKSLARPRPSEPDGFPEWYAAYPRHVARAAALTAYTKAAKKAARDVLLTAAQRFADDPTRDPAYTPHPASWLNAERWLDEGPVRPQSTAPAVNKSDERTSRNLALVAHFEQQEQLGIEAG